MTSRGLSFLDLMLAAAFVFVVIHSMTTIRSELPEVQAKSAVVVLRIPATQHGGDVRLRVAQYDPNNRLVRRWQIDRSSKQNNGSAEYQVTVYDGNGNPLRNPKQNDPSGPTLRIDKSLMSQRILILTGEPDPGGRIEISGSYFPTGDGVADLLSAVRTYQERKRHGPTQKRLPWTESGLKLLLAFPTWSTEKKEAERSKWINEGVRVGFIEKRGDAIRIEEAPQNTSESLKDAIAFSRIVFHLLHQRSPFRNAGRFEHAAYARVHRHLTLRFNQVTVAQLLGSAEVAEWFAGAKEGTQVPSSPQNCSAHLKRDGRVPQWMGLFAGEDAIAEHIIRPVQVTCSHGGAQVVAAAPWRPPRNDNGNRLGFRIEFEFQENGGPRLP